MKNSTFIAFLLCICLGLSVSAQPGKKERFSKKTQKSVLKKRTKLIKATNEVLLFEDFSKFTAGSEAAPDNVDLANEENGYIISEEYTLVPEWAGVGVFQAGGCAYLGMVEYSNGVFPGEIETPIMDLTGNQGNFTLKFKARSNSAAGDAFYVMWYDYMDETGEVGDDYMLDITNEWKEYTVDFTGATDYAVVYLTSYDEDCFIDDVQLFKMEVELLGLKLL